MTKIKNRCKAENFSGILTKENIAEALTDENFNERNRRYGKRIQPGKMVSLGSYEREIKNICYFNAHKVVRNTVSRIYIEVNPSNLIEPGSWFFLFIKSYEWPDEHRFLKDKEREALVDSLKPIFAYDIINDAWFEVGEEHKIIRGEESMILKPPHKLKIDQLKNIIQCNSKIMLNSIYDCMTDY